MSRLTLLAFLVGRVHAQCTPDGQGECSEDAVDEASALLQTQVGKHQQGDRAPPHEMMNYEDVDKFDFDKYTKDNPTCMKGLMFMDQLCKGTPQLPPSQQKRPCSGKMFVQTEFTTAFGPYNASSKCFMFRRDMWTVGRALALNMVCPIPGPHFCMTDSSRRAGHGPCDLGAQYVKRGTNYAIAVTESGWDRLTDGAHYPVFQIVNPEGQRTKWWDLYAGIVNQKGCWSDRLIWPVCQGPSKWAPQVARCKYNGYPPEPIQ